MKKKKYFLCIMFLITISAFAQNAFQDHLISQSIDAPYIVLSADLDNDGNMDMIYGSNETGLDGIFWYKNGGLGDFYPQQSIESRAGSITSLDVADLDNDGDLDLLSSSWRNSTVAWYENLDGKGAFGSRKIITINTFGSEVVSTGDMDDDGDIDVFAASSEIIYYYKNNGKGNFELQQQKSLKGTHSLITHDMDKDGDLDLVFATNNYILADKIGWYENINGTFGTKHTIADTNNIFSISLADLNGDGNTDIVSASPYRDKIVWYENTDGIGNFGPERILTTDYRDPRTVFIADVDSDGDMDILFGSYDDSSRFPSSNQYMIAWFENTDGKGSFSSLKTISTSIPGSDSIHATDIDNDGDIDLFSTGRNYDNVYWHENIDGRGTFDNPHIINQQIKSSSTFVADFNGDGYKDIASVSDTDGKVIWYKNLDGRGDFGKQLLIDDDTDRPISIQAADIDKDDDIDIVVAEHGTIYWYKNTDSKGTFLKQKVIASGLIEIVSIYLVDIDNDGDMDVLSASYFDNAITWYENTDGTGNFGAQQIISNRVDRASDVYAIDVDNDGDIDVISASSVSDKVVWYENTNGIGAFSSEKIITNSFDRAYSVFSVDLDNDGDMDVLAGSSEGKIVWYENVDSLGTFSTELVIADNQATGFVSVRSFDMDNDGDMDVVYSHRPDFSAGKIVWHENVNGQGNFKVEHIIAKDDSLFISISDVDDDGDKDVISSSNELNWYENLRTEKDNDSDGVTDDKDLCANTPSGAQVNTDGCAQSQLDDDNDGVNNTIDLCDNTPTGAQVNTDGCAQSQLDDDNDGVNNTIDLCDNTPTGAQVNTDGCAQSQLDDDNDGVNNTIDLCDNTPSRAQVNSNGCAQSQLDDDNDGVTNDIDLCDNTPLNIDVDEEGCPVIIQQSSTVAYPNPSSNNITIGIPDIKIDETTVDVNVYDLQQKLVLSKTYSIIDSEIEVVLNDIPNGIYFIKIERDTPIFLRIIKQ